MHPMLTGASQHRACVQETPGLKGDAAECANALCGYLRLEQQRFAKQERNTSTPRDDLVDGRVDVILYFLPINARIREMDRDTTDINAIASYAPVIPVMTRVRPPLPLSACSSAAAYIGVLCFVACCAAGRGTTLQHLCGIDCRPPML